MADQKQVARIPIIPDDLANGNNHINHELLMDFEHDDIYVKKDNGYINITGKIKEDVKQIKDGSSVIHIVTPETLPPIKERSENNWYYIIDRAEDAGGGSISTANYIYYGLIKSYKIDKNYLLVAQNVSSGNDTIPFEILEGYCPCLYIPINYSATFKNHVTGEDIDFTIEDRIYALNNLAGTYVAYDVYILNLFEQGSYLVDVDLSGSNNFTIHFEPNIEDITGLVLPDDMKIPDGDCIGTIQDPEWDNPRYIFQGWSTEKIAPTIIDPSVYKPESNLTLYAWFNYNDDPSLITYYSEYTE